MLQSRVDWVDGSTADLWSQMRMRRNLSMISSEGCEVWYMLQLQ